MSDEFTRTEADAVAEIATNAATKAVPMTAEEYAAGLKVVLPAGSTLETLDLEHFLMAPRRMRGRTDLVSEDSFAAQYNKQRTAGASTMYADVDAHRVVAVLNDAAGPDKPGWLDHLLVLQMKTTPEWDSWIKRDGVLMSQVDFAEHIENSTPEIVTPDAATMLEVAQSFHAHTKVTFESSKRLADGQTQIEYREDVQQSAGAKGEIEVPTEIVLSISPFVTGDDYELRALLRTRISNGALAIGYKLVRPERVLERAFDEVLAGIKSTTGEDVLYGTPPSL